MRRAIIVMLAGLLAVYFGAAQAVEVPASGKQIDGAGSRAPNRGALFKVSKSGHTLYLFGTIHVGQDSFYPLEPRVSAALAGASVIALEVDMSDDPQSMQAMVQKYGIYAPTDGLDKHVPAALYKRLQDLAVKYNLPTGAIDRLKPGMVGSFIAVSESALLGYQVGQGVDTYIADYAKARSKPVVGLETIEGQLAMIEKMTEPEQIDCLEGLADEIEGESARKKVIEIVELWRSADVAGQEAFAKETAGDDSVCGKYSSRVLLNERNPGLANGIKAIIDNEKNAFAGIGLMHLIGKGSVPDLLSRRGYLVERIY